MLALGSLSIIYAFCNSTAPAPTPAPVPVALQAAATAPAPAAEPLVKKEMTTAQIEEIARLEKEKGRAYEIVSVDILALCIHLLAIG